MPASPILSHLMDNVIDYCKRQDTRDAIDAKILTPLVRYLAERFSWSVRLFQLVVVLVLVQTILLLWMLVRELRRA